MTPKDQQNMTHERQRYRSRERQLQITPDPMIVEPEAERPNMGDNEGDKRSKEEEFAQHLLKAVQDLSIRVLRSGGSKLAATTRAKGLKGNSKLARALTLRITTGFMAPTHPSFLVHHSGPLFPHL